MSRMASGSIHLLSPVACCHRDILCIARLSCARARHEPFGGENEVVSIVEWKSEKVAGSQLSVLFKFKGDKIYEERWFVDTEQWKNAF